MACMRGGRPTHPNTTTETPKPEPNTQTTPETHKKQVLKTGYKLNDRVIRPAQVGTVKKA